VPFARPLNVYAPELFAVAVAPEVPLNVTVAPPPPAAGLNVPEIVKVCGATGLFTLTVTPALVALFPAPSVATARSVWLPFAVLLESHE
jgi:hypothetical protein